MSKHKNPYNEGSAYHAIFEAWGKAKDQSISRTELVEMGFSPHDITVVLSPREEGQSRGDIRGNASAAGHVYCAKVVGKGRAKSFRRMWRKVVLDSLKRKSQRDKVPASKKETKETKATKETKVTKTVKAKAKSKAKVKKAPAKRKAKTVKANVETPVTVTEAVTEAVTETATETADVKG